MGRDGWGDVAGIGVFRVRDRRGKLGWVGTGWDGVKWKISKGTSLRERDKVGLGTDREAELKVHERLGRP